MRIGIHTGPGRLRPGRRQLADGLHGDRRYGQCRRPTSASGRAGNDPAERSDPPAGARLCARRAGRTAHSQRQGRADPGISPARRFASPLRAARVAIASHGGFCRSRERARDLEQFPSAGRKRAWPGGRPRRRARHRQVSAARRVPPAGRRRARDLGRRTLPFLRHRDPLLARSRPVAQQLRDSRDRHPAMSSPTRSASGLREVGMDPDEDGPVLLHLLEIKDAAGSPALSNPEAVKGKAFETLAAAERQGQSAASSGSGARGPPLGRQGIGGVPRLSRGKCPRRPGPAAGHLPARLSASLDRQVLCGADPAAAAVAGRQHPDGPLGAPRGASDRPGDRRRSSPRRTAIRSFSSNWRCTPARRGTFART